MVEQVREYRNMLVEAVAEYDDALLEKFFDNPDSITEDVNGGSHPQGKIHRYRYHRCFVVLPLRTKVYNSCWMRFAATCQLPLMWKL